MSSSINQGPLLWMIVDFNFDGPSYHYHPSKVHAERYMGAVFGEYDKHSHCEYQYQVVPPAPARSGVRKGIVSEMPQLEHDPYHSVHIRGCCCRSVRCKSYG